MNSKNAQPALERSALSLPHSNSKSGTDRAVPSSRAFTFVELLVVVGTLALSAALLLPALANTSPDSAASQCRSNHRQLMIAWAMYSDDNKDVLALNTDQSAALPPATSPTPPWVGGKLDWGVHGAGDPNTNTLYLTDPRGSALANYDGRNPKLFKCPSDNYLSSAQLRTYVGYSNGAYVQLGRIRSISMNGAIGGGNPIPGQSGYKPPVSLVSILTSGYFYAVKRSQIVSPGPAQSWVLFDENPDSIDDCITYMDPYATNGLGTMIAVPAGGHDSGGTVAFADGHVEIHRWNDARTLHPVSYSPYGRVAISGQPSADLAWLARHTPRAP